MWFTPQPQNHEEAERGYRQLQAHLGGVAEAKNRAETSKRRIGYFFAVAMVAVMTGLGMVVHEWQMEMKSARFEMAGLRKEVAEARERSLPNVIVQRGSVYTGQGRVVIQGFDEEVQNGTEPDE